VHVVTEHARAAPKITAPFHPYRLTSKWQRGRRTVEQSVAKSVASSPDTFDDSNMTDINLQTVTVHAVHRL
jgi:hypothetical protein